MDAIMGYLHSCQQVMFLGAYYCLPYKVRLPNDIGSLSSLAHLNLSWNNLVFPPESNSQLSSLRKLHLEGFRMLQSLENVRSTLDFVIANDCTSVERLPKLQNDPFGLYHSKLFIHCRLNCFKLVDNIQSGSNMLQVSLPKF